MTLKPVVGKAGEEGLVQLPSKKWMACNTLHFPFQLKITKIQEFRRRSFLTHKRQVKFRQC